MSRKDSIIIGSDHQGFTMKEFIKEQLSSGKIEVKDVGTFTADEPSDYPLHVSRVAGAVSGGQFKRGIAICGSGVGASVVANRFPKVRAALCNDISVAKIARAHNDSNVLILAGRLTPEWLASQILETWLTTSFEGGRHLRRVKLIDDNTQLGIALGHLDQIDPNKIESEWVNQPFMRRALKGLEKIMARMSSDRRDKSTPRLPGSCPTRITYEGRRYPALMLDLSRNGAQFRLQEPSVITQFMIDDSVELAIKTPYGPSTCTGILRWVDNQSKTIGVAFTSFPHDKKDPLQLLGDSIL